MGGIALCQRKLCQIYEDHKEGTLPFYVTTSEAVRLRLAASNRPHRYVDLDR